MSHFEGKVCANQALQETDLFLLEHLTPLNGELELHFRASSIVGNHHVVEVLKLMSTTQEEGDREEAGEEPGMDLEADGFRLWAKASPGNWPSVSRFMFQARGHSRERLWVYIKSVRASCSRFQLTSADRCDRRVPLVRRHFTRWTSARSVTNATASNTNVKLSSRLCAILSCRARL